MVEEGRSQRWHGAGIGLYETDSSVETIPVTIFLGMVVLRLTRMAERTARVLARAQRPVGVGERRAQALIERSWDVIQLMDAEGKIRYVSPAQERVLGYETREVVGRSAFDFLHPDDAARSRERLRELLGKPGGTMVSTIRVRHKDGSWRWTERVGTNLLVDRAVRAIVVNYRDVTEQKLAQEAIRLRNEELESLAAVANTLVQAASLKQRLAMMLEKVSLAAQTDGAILRYPDQESQCLRPVAWHFRGIFPETVPRVAPFGRSLTDVAYRQGAMIVVNDYVSHPLASPEVVASGIRSLVGLPVKVGDTTLGVVSVLSRQINHFTQERVKILSVIVNSLGALVENARLAEEDHLRSEQLAVLSRRLTETQEQERQRLARELHDELGQVLTGLKLRLEMIMRCPAQEMKTQVEVAQSMVTALMAQVRGLSMDLRPQLLDDLGLVPALLWLIERYTASTGVSVDFQHAGMDRRFSPELETAAFRIIQEALTNVARHANVNEAIVKVKAEEHYVHLEVSDRGRGFMAEAVTTALKGTGIAGIAERVRMLGGRLAVESVPGRGTTVAVALPLVYTGASKR